MSSRRRSSGRTTPGRGLRRDLALTAILGLALVLVLGVYSIPILLSQHGGDRPSDSARSTEGSDPYVAEAARAEFRAPDVSTEPAAVPPRATVVSITFDDGFAEIPDAARILTEHGLRGTFFVNSGDLGKPGHVGLDGLRAMAVDGHEIGGHSFEHFDLTGLPVDEAHRDVCVDRSALLDWGFHVRSFAFPFAAANPELERVVAACGYNSARSLEELWDRNWCEDCPNAESIPPANPSFTRASSQAENDWDMGELQARVTAAQQSGGWLQLTFHRLCTDDCSNRIAVSTALFEQFVAWLDAERDAGRVIVLPTGDVIGGAVQDSRPAPPPRSTPAGENTLRNPQLVDRTVPGVPDCWMQTGFGDNRAGFDLVETPEGGIAQRVVVTDYRDGDAKLVPTMDLGTCAPSVAAGRTYRLEASYASTAPTRFAVYYRLPRGVWTYWLDSPEFSSTGAGTSRAQWTTPPIPPDATAISFGLTLTENGELVTYVYAMVEHATLPGQ
ncbi:MAG TPA: polysaccharide deacetylase family protein [Aldersonia sp.]